MNSSKRKESKKKKSKKGYGKGEIMNSSDSTHHKFEKHEYKHFHDQESSNYGMSERKYFGISILIN